MLKVVQDAAVSNEALLNPPAPTALKPKTTTTKTAPRKEIAATA